MKTYSVQCQMMKPGAYDCFPFVANSNGNTVATVLVDEYYDYGLRRTCYKVLVETVTTIIESGVVARGFDRSCNPYGLRRVSNTTTESRSFEYDFGDIYRCCKYFSHLGIDEDMYDDFTCVRVDDLLADDSSIDFDFNDPLDLGISDHFELLL